MRDGRRRHDDLHLREAHARLERVGEQLVGVVRQVRHGELVAEDRQRLARVDVVVERTGVGVEGVEQVLAQQRLRVLLPGPVHEQRHVAQPHDDLAGAGRVVGAARVVTGHLGRGVHPAVAHRAGHLHRLAELEPHDLPARDGGGPPAVDAAVEEQEAAAGAGVTAYCRGAGRCGLASPTSTRTPSASAQAARVRPAPACTTALVTTSETASAVASSHSSAPAELTREHTARRASETLRASGASSWRASSTAPPDPRRSGVRRRAPHRRTGPRPPSAGTRDPRRPGRPAPQEVSRCRSRVRSCGRAGPRPPCARAAAARRRAAP